MVNRPFQIFSFVSNRFTIRIRRPLVQSLGACLPGEMETWTEVAKHLREADYNAGATLGAFLLGFVIQFTLRKGGYRMSGMMEKLICPLMNVIELLSMLQKEP